MKQIACPVALHPDGATRRIAIFQDPTGSLQLAHTIAPSPQDATGSAARLLYAMSALETRAALPIGTLATSTEMWHFALCRIVPPVRDQWKHLHAETGTLLHWTWMPLDAPLEGLRPQDTRALEWITATL
jgi:hypothetical protein